MSAEDAPPSTESLKRPVEDSFPNLGIPTEAQGADLINGEKPGKNGEEDQSQPPQKRQKVEEADSASGEPKVARVKGHAAIKKEYLIPISQLKRAAAPEVDDDAAESAPRDGKDARDGKGGKKKARGQNTQRQFGSSRDAIQLCASRALCNEFSPKECRYGDRCSSCHDLRKYLKEGKREDLTTLNGKCPVYEAYGKCFAGWKCRFLSSHFNEIEHEDGRKELVLLQKDTDGVSKQKDDMEPSDVCNIVSTEDKLSLSKRKMKLDKADQFTDWLTKDGVIMEKHHNHIKGMESKEDIRAQFTEPPFKPSEKRRLYFGPETPVLAPLTTQGNLPFRRLCVELGCELTYSEMAMSLPLIQGQKGEWALMKAHQSEMTPPRFSPRPNTVVQGYDNAKDVKFGAQISGSKPWQVLKATEALSRLVPNLRAIDLNCGCPIDLVYQTGAGSALLDASGKLEKMIRGMHAVSGSIPVTCKIRMGTKDDTPNALKNIERLALGGAETRERLGAPGCAAITLHGRSRQQRYTRSANWEYIAECSALIKSYNERKDEVTDTIREPDESTLANGGRIYFLGNGDCYSHVDYFDHIEKAGVDSVMIGRGALVKPWIYEEIQAGQYLDKSASERLAYVEKFAKYGMQAWGSDEIGLGLTRRFLLEWLSFAHRYVPIGLLEYLPPSLQDRPPAYRGRNDLETLLSSSNYQDWIKISEMFLGPAHKDFKFQPKHKSHSYDKNDIEAEG